jgi:Fic family protein
MNAYNWQQPDWRQFRYSVTGLADLLSTFAEDSAHTSGMLRAMPKEANRDAVINMMVAEALKTSEIEGELLQRSDVLSSIRNNLGLSQTKEKVKDKRVQGVAELMIAVRDSFGSPLSEKDLFRWHAMLMKYSVGVKTGVWRTHKEPMQVISGAAGKEKVHFEAPPSSRVPKEMFYFIQWFNDSAPGGKNEIKKSPVRAAIAHLYFESIHPFEDGNGRIGRAIAEKALSQGIGRPVLLSLSLAIEAKKKKYYEQLKKAQSGNTITEWIKYFVNIVLDAQRQAKEMITLTLMKARFFDKFRDKFNDRQEKVIRKMLEAEPKGFEGGMTAKKYISMTKASKATATRDLQLLTEIGALIAGGGGRSVHYRVNLGE